ncbi:hypothetical protein GCM10027275_00410 [Rhabdobacter roseus]|uniref:Uncharacterized protein n=1 Tax=Rhabdobacter roseus TaxID=1655419 RepID=A0A840TG56_9BACT|nr:hypothetical protein [Rhabdobacter roseus]MBB5281925.1 hypothetical protein [Rhabdobacter roseus]
MKKIPSTLLFLVLLAPLVQAQYLTDINGRAVTEQQYTDVEGSPYLKDKWYLGTIRAQNGKVYDGVKMRYDAYKDEVEYEQQGKMYRLGAAETLEFSIPTDDDLYIFRRGFPKVDRQTDASFYRVLHDGNTKLLKRYENRMRDEKPYNSATVTRRFEPSEKLYVLKGGTMYPIKKNDRKGMLKILSDRKRTMEYAIKEQQLDFRTESDIIKILEEYDAYQAGDGKY